jgi:glycosyltransferase involved in cell wall biosynthesis
MKILFTAPRFHTNQHYAVKALLKAGHEVAFFALRQGGSEEYSALTPLVLGYSPMFNFLCKLLRKENSYNFIHRFAFPPIWRFLREVRAFRPSVVIVRDPNTAYGLLSLIAAKVLGAKVIFYTQGPKYRRMGIVERLTKSLFLALFGAQWITPVLGELGPDTTTLKRMHYVPFVIEPGVPPEKKVWFAGGVVNIMTVGKFEPRKNHVLLLRAVRELVRAFPLRLTIVGECTTAAHREELGRVQQCIKALQLEKIVTIKLNLSFSAVQELYATHDLFVLPSRDEPAAVSILEAAANSLPVICSDSNGTKCYIEEGQNGYIFRSDDLQDLVAKMHLIIQDRSRLVEMGRRSYQLVLERHMPERYKRALMEIIMKME